MDVKDLGVVVTGGASGLGGATAAKLALLGAKVTIFDLNEELGASHAAAIGGLFCRVNVADEADVIAGFDAAEAAHGTTRVLVNCAGIAVAVKTVGRDGAHTLELFQKVININLGGTFNCIRIAAERMCAAGRLDGSEEGGVIINTASVAAYDGQIGQAAYSASKGGVVGMTLPIARDLARDGIRVNTIAPGLFQTPLFQGLPEDAVAALSKSVPNPARLGDPKEYGSLAAHIVENAYINGETIRLDGAIRMAPK